MHKVKNTDMHYKRWATPSVKNSELIHPQLRSLSTRTSLYSKQNNTIDSTSKIQAFPFNTTQRQMKAYANIFFEMWRKL